MWKDLKNFKIKREHLHEGKQTICTDLLTTLKICSDLAQKLAKKKHKYDDPDFGPSSDDVYGEKALYYEGVTPGGILPEDVIWLRPE